MNSDTSHRPACGAAVKTNIQKPDWRPARHGRVLAQYAGHLHVHGHDQSGGTHVITTSGLCNYPGEYRLVTVKRDRIEHRCVGIPALAKQPRCWTDCVDEAHPSVDLFHGGLPHERDFVIRYGDQGRHQP